MKKTKHQVQNLAKLKGSADAKKIFWYTKTYLFMCELKQNSKSVVNDIMCLLPDCVSFWNTIRTSKLLFT